MKKQLITFILILLALFCYLKYTAPEGQPSTSIEALQARVEQLETQQEQLRIEMDDVKHVQGQLLWDDTKPIIYE